MKIKISGNKIRLTIKGLVPYNKKENKIEII